MPDNFSVIPSQPNNTVGFSTSFFPSGQPEVMWIPEGQPQVIANKTSPTAFEADKADLGADIKWAWDSFTSAVSDVASHIWQNLPSFGPSVVSGAETLKPIPGEHMPSEIQAILDEGPTITMVSVQSGFSQKEEKLTFKRTATATVTCPDFSEETWCSKVDTNPIDSTIAVKEAPTLSFMPPKYQVTPGDSGTKVGLSYCNISIAPDAKSFTVEGRCDVTSSDTGPYSTEWAGNGWSSVAPECLPVIVYKSGDEIKSVEGGCINAKTQVQEGGVVKECVTSIAPAYPTFTEQLTAQDFQSDCSITWCQTVSPNGQRESTKTLAPSCVLQPLHFDYQGRQSVQADINGWQTYRLSAGAAKPASSFTERLQAEKTVPQSTKGQKIEL